MIAVVAAIAGGLLALVAIFSMVTTECATCHGPSGRKVLGLWMPAPVARLTQIGTIYLCRRCDAKGHADSTARQAYRLVQDQERDALAEVYDEYASDLYEARLAFKRGAEPGYVAACLDKILADPAHAACPAFAPCVGDLTAFVVHALPDAGAEFRAAVVLVLRRFADLRKRMVLADTLRSAWRRAPTVASVAAALAPIAADPCVGDVAAFLAWALGEAGEKFHDEVLASLGLHAERV